LKSFLETSKLCSVFEHRNCVLFWSIEIATEEEDDAEEGAETLASATGAGTETLASATAQEQKP
jgi:hypothetical protein